MNSRWNWPTVVSIGVAIIGIVLSIALPEVRRFLGLDRILPALQALGPSPAPSPRPTPNLIELENERLRKDIESARALAKANDERADKLQTQLDTLNRQIAEMRDAQKRVAPPAEVQSVTPTPPNKTFDIPPPRQKLEHFVVEVPRAQTRGENATVYIRFTNTTAARIKMLLADGFLGRDKTFLTDDNGQRFLLDNSSGIGKCCFGFAGGDWQGAILDLAPKASGDVTLTFRRRNRYGEREHEPQSFTLTAELTIGDAVKLQTWHGLQWQSSGSAAVNIAGITPR